MSHETKRTHRVDRTGWEPGPWDAEGDRYDWTTAVGLPGLIVRVPLHGALCGYVAVAEGHPCFGRPYDELPGFDVHREISYSDFCAGDICHVPQPGQPDRVWWIGFACAGAWDVMPGLAAHLPRTVFDSLGHDAVYRDLAYVRAEVESLAKQIAAVR